MIYYLVYFNNQYTVVQGIPDKPETWHRLHWYSSLSYLLVEFLKALKAGTNTSYFEPLENSTNASTLKEAIEMESKHPAFVLLKMSILLETSDPSTLDPDIIYQNHPEILL